MTHFSLSLAPTMQSICLNLNEIYLWHTLHLNCPHCPHLQPLMLTFCRAALQSNCRPSCVTSTGRSNGVATNSPSSLLNWAKILFSPASRSLVYARLACSRESAIFPLKSHVLKGYICTVYRVLHCPQSRDVSWVIRLIYCRGARQTYLLKKIDEELLACYRTWLVLGPHFYCGM